MPTVHLPARVHTATVTEHRELARDVVLLAFDAPALVEATRPGQYVMAVPPSGEAAAVALGIYEAESKRISLLFFVIGKRTRELSRLRPGDRIGVVGPLGNGFDLSTDAHDVAIVAGGVGIASVLLCAQELARRGKRVRLFFGARTAELLVDVDRFAELGCELVLATDDGSRGERGYITQLLEREAAPQLIYACGPSPMLRSVARIANEYGVRAQLSLEETFGCGVGGCWGCVVPLIATSPQAPSFPPAAMGGSDVAYARICKEGPVFWADELRW